MPGRGNDSIGLRMVLAVVALGIAALILATLAFAGTGGLTQKPGAEGCISEGGRGGCQVGVGLRAIVAPLAISPDGRSAYAASSFDNTLVVLDRDPATGTLRQKAGASGCFSLDGTGGKCQRLRSLEGTIHAVVSPDGRNVYAASLGQESLVVFDRDPATGTLTPKPGQAGCISATGSGGLCAKNPLAKGIGDLAISPDGEQAYATSLKAQTVLVFDRDPASGALHQRPGGCFGLPGRRGLGGHCKVVRGLGGPVHLALSPDGRSAYVTNFFSSAVLVFDRDPASGALSQRRGAGGCISRARPAEGCASSRGLNHPEGVLVSPDGRDVYVGDSSGALVAFDRKPSGALSQPAGRAVCVAARPAREHCQRGRGIASPASIAISPDGRSLYAASAVSESVASFSRNPATGRLSQARGRAACVSAEGRFGCAEGRSLEDAINLAISPDGANVYVTAFGDDAIAIFDR